MTKVSSDEFIENCKKLNDYYSQIMSYIINNKNLNYTDKFFDKSKHNEALIKFYEQIITHPEKFTSINIDYLNDFQKLITNSVSKFMGTGENTVAPENRDRRFKDPEWGHNAYFDFVKNYYLLTSEWIKKIVNNYEVDEDSKSYIEFSTQQFIDAISPSNFVFTNPVVLKEAFETGFKNIVNGMENFINDLRKSKELMTISTSDKSHFKLGENIATTKGKVVFQNELMQLICYEPKSKTYQIPMLIIPPWINKYYILDLSSKNSLIQWLVNNNHQVFLISWVNPKKKNSHFDFEDYLELGLLEAIKQIKKFGYTKVNTTGYCIGGTLLTCALAYLKKINRDDINSASFFTTLIDFSKPGEIKTFINKDNYEQIAADVNEKGYLDGKYLSNSFSLIRANDLIWSFFINNYLLGKAPAAFDILYWNSDGTNLPAKMYLYYIKNMYIENNLIKKNKLEMLSEKLNIEMIDVPSYSVAAKTDHIALWGAVYDGYKLLGGDQTFCLTDAGHVAGIVNPPTSSKYSYNLGKNIVNSKEEWLELSKKFDGSWWISWNEWLGSKSGKLIKKIEYDKLISIEPAPGSYVRK